jgi:hypothetical protein
MMTRRAAQNKRCITSIPEKPSRHRRGFDEFRLRKLRIMGDHGLSDARLHQLMVKAWFHDLTSYERTHFEEEACQMFKEVDSLSK